MPSLASQPLCHHCSQCQNLPSPHYISGGDEDGEDDKDGEDSGGDEDDIDEKVEDDICDALTK